MQIELSDNVLMKRQKCPKVEQQTFLTLRQEGMVTQFILGEVSVPSPSLDGSFKSTFIFQDSTRKLYKGALHSARMK